MLKKNMFFHFAFQLISMKPQLFFLTRLKNIIIIFLNQLTNKKHDKIIKNVIWGGEKNYTKRSYMFLHIIIHDRHSWQLNVNSSMCRRKNKHVCMSHTSSNKLELSGTLSIKTLLSVAGCSMTTFVVFRRFSSGSPSKLSLLWQGNIRAVVRLTAHTP